MGSPSHLSIVCEAFGYASDLFSCRKCKLPFVSSVDHIEGDYKFKPGTYKDDVNYMHDVITHNVTTHDVTTHNVTTHDVTTHNVTTHDVTMHNVTMHDVTIQASI